MNTLSSPSSLLAGLGIVLNFCQRVAVDALLSVRPDAAKIISQPPVSGAGSIPKIPDGPGTRHARLLDEAKKPTLAQVPASSRTEPQGWEHAVRNIERLNAEGVKSSKIATRLGFLTINDFYKFVAKHGVKLKKIKGQNCSRETIGAIELDMAKACIDRGPSAARDTAVLLQIADRHNVSPALVTSIWDRYVNRSTRTEAAS